ncbi:hypothetical protein SNOG_06830 [Parastagonospora nodorum SN15]|uniref:Uncharacterized protein n=1 Tax=Phaeosphaeria nodorum (strain SN15 / ATCC MYA-4574 / FGSC 10173) TaxID=321614 RepID=Q0UN34_PHANO|nr:hypothetical protein SNOG_06830 [Parastagonospora nodorum SN15]EAT85481.1 hypothetical protein SNOG_06830 [Parastagonospora nodorum SN15]
MDHAALQRPDLCITGCGRREHTWSLTRWERRSTPSHQRATESSCTQQDSSDVSGLSMLILVEVKVHTIAICSGKKKRKKAAMPRGMQSYLLSWCTTGRVRNRSAVDV